MSTEDISESNLGFRRWLEGVRPYLKQIGITIGIIMVGALGSALLLYLRPTPPRAPDRQVAALVAALPVHASSETVRVTGYGTVRPSKELLLRPQVSGRVISVHPAFEVGGIVQSEEIVFEIDPRDYKIAAESARAAVARAEFELEVEKGSQVVAKREWELLGKEVQTSEFGKELALRRPHLREKEAALLAAQSQLDKALLDLERTYVKSPFSAVVLEESLEVGSFVSNLQQVGRLAATGSFYIEMKVGTNDLQWIDLTSEESRRQHQVSIYPSSGAVEEKPRQGRMLRLLGEVEETGRMAKFLVAVEDPLSASSEQRPLLLGSFVKVVVKGKVVDNVFGIPRYALREDNSVWVVDEQGKLRRKKITPVFTTSDRVYVRGNLTDGDQVVTSSLLGALEGMLVRVDADSQRSPSESSSGSEG